MNWKDVKNTEIAYTHAGMFHTDDLFSSVILKLINPGIKIVRITDDETEKYKDGFLFDIGRGEYDHHAEIKKRENGNVYAAFGLLFKDLWPFFFTEKTFIDFDSEFVVPIDRSDNCGKHDALSSSLRFFGKQYREEKTDNELFNEAVEFFIPILREFITNYGNGTVFQKNADNIYAIAAEGLKLAIKKFQPYYEDVTENTDDHVIRFRCMHLYPESYQTLQAMIRTIYEAPSSDPINILIKHVSYETACNLVAKIAERQTGYLTSRDQAYNDLRRKFGDTTNYYLVLDENMPYKKFTDRNRRVKFVIAPIERGGVCLSCVEKSKSEKIGQEREYRVYIDEDLARHGGDKEYLSQCYPGLQFVHKGGHLAFFDTKENAINYLKNRFNT